MRISVENIKCGGCANSIRKGLLEMDGISAVDVGIEEGWVEVTTASASRETIVERLRSMGYPETGSVHGLGAAGAKARSFVSCAVGRMSGD
jgi:copper chaperone